MRFAFRDAQIRGAISKDPSGSLRPSAHHSIFRWRRRWSIQVITSLSASMALSTAGMPAEAAPAVSKVLERAPVAGGTVQLVAQNCLAEGCDMVVKFVTSKGASSTVALPWDASNENFTSEPVNGAWGAIDVLAPEYVDLGWLSGDEERYVSTSMRLVLLAKNDVGVVVDQRGGFDHIGHAHVLMVIRKGKLVEVQRWVGNGGPSWSGVTVSNGEVLHNEVFFSPDPTVADSSTFTAYRSDAGGAKLVKQTRKAPLWAVVVESYPSVAIARQTLNSSNETDLNGLTCLASINVLASKILPTPGASKAFIGAVSTNENYAKAKAASIQKCAKRWKSVSVQTIM